MVGTVTRKDLERWQEDAFLLRLDLGAISARLRKRDAHLVEVRKRLLALRDEVIALEGPAARLAQMALFE